jgi:hypothetical protein
MQLEINPMKVEITAGGIFGAKGEIPIGTIVDVKTEPKGWAGRYRVISGKDGKETAKTTIVNPDNSEYDDLKKQADELGLQYAGNISKAKLKELIDAKLAE